MPPEYLQIYSFLDKSNQNTLIKKKEKKDSTSVETRNLETRRASDL